MHYRSPPTPCGKTGLFLLEHKQSAACQRQVPLQFKTRRATRLIRQYKTLSRSISLSKARKAHIECNHTRWQGIPEDNCATETASESVSTACLSTPEPTSSRHGLVELLGGKGRLSEGQAHTLLARSTSEAKGTPETEKRDGDSSVQPHSGFQTLLELTGQGLPTEERGEAKKKELRQRSISKDWVG